MFFSKTVKPSSTTSDLDGKQLTSDEITEILRPIIDPDIGVSIIDLGLIYKIKNADGNIAIDMTFTTPACPYGPQLMEEIRYTLKSIPGVNDVNIEVVWDPPWSLENISEATRLEMGMDI